MKRNDAWLYDYKLIRQSHGFYDEPNPEAREALVAELSAAYGPFHHLGELPAEDVSDEDAAAWNAAKRLAIHRYKLACSLKN